MAQKIVFTTFVLTLFSSFAQAKVTPLSSHDVTRFQQKIDFTVSGITTPKVVTYQSNKPFGDFVALQNKATKEFVTFKSSQKQENRFWEFPVESTSALVDANIGFIQDQNKGTFITFDPGLTTHRLTFNNPALYMPSELKLNLAPNSTPPKNVSIRAILPGSKTWKTIVNKHPYSSSIIFPQIQPQQIEVIFESSNLLRLSELELTTTNLQSTTKQQISFYAQEGGNFTLWTQPHFGQKRMLITQGSPTKTDSSTPVFTLPPASANPAFNEDFDLDGILDSQDLCPKIKDPKNTDKDNNKKGDVCEDPDQDGEISYTDNCPFAYNPKQSDKDVDGIGDECDEEEGRLSERGDFWINISFGVMMLALFFLIGRSAWQMHKQKQ